MIKQFSIVTILIIFICAGFSGCIEDSNSNENNSNESNENNHTVNYNIIGTWLKSSGEKIIFNANGTVYLEKNGVGQLGVYSVSNESLTFIFISQGQNYTSNASFEFPDDNTLKLIYKSGTEEYYSKQ